LTRAFLISVDSRLHTSLSGAGMDTERFDDIEQALAGCADKGAPDLFVVHCLPGAAGAALARLTESNQTQGAPILVAIEAKPNLIVIGDLVIDPEGVEVRVGDRLVPLTFREYELLKFLATQRGRVFTRKGLIEAIWEYDYLSGTRTVDVHVRRLRSKLGPRYGAMIETVRNVGYRFSRYDTPE